jgi:hypothetical protein
MKCFRYASAGASLFMLTLVLGAQEPAYGLTVTSDGQPRSGSFPSLYYQPYNIPIRNIDGATACAGPRRFIQQDVTCSRFDGRRIGDNVRSRCVRDNGAQGETGEGHGSSIGWGLLCPSDARWFDVNFFIDHRIIDRLAFSDINQPIKDAFLWRKEKQAGVELLSSLPRVNWNVYADLIAPVQRTAWQKFFNHVASGQKSSLGIDKKGGAINAELLRRIEASNRSNRTLDSGDSADELVIALGDGGGEQEQVDQTTQKQDGATSRTITSQSVSPYSVRCRTTIRNDVWDVQCPKDSSEGHIEAYSSGATQ